MILLTGRGEQGQGFLSRRIICGYSLIIGVFIMSLGNGVFAADDETNVKIKEGLRFSVPPDWPIEKRGGIVGPIPVEEYVTMKFKMVESRLDALDQDLSGKFSEIKTTIETIKKDVTNSLQEVKSGMEATNGDLKELSYNLKAADSKIDTVGSKGDAETNKCKMFEAQLKALEKQIKDLTLRLELLEAKVESAQKIDNILQGTEE